MREPLRSDRVHRLLHNCRYDYNPCGGLVYLSVTSISYAHLAQAAGAETRNFSQRQFNSKQIFP